MIVSKMEKTDIPYLVEIERQAFGKGDYDNFEKCLNNPIYQYFVAKEGYIILGYAGMLSVDDNTEIITIAVENNKRHMGVGTRLMETMIEKAQKIGARSMSLEVNVNNNIARKMYDKFKFVPISIRKKYYNNSDDAVILKLSF